MRHASYSAYHRLNRLIDTVARVLPACWMTTFDLLNMRLPLPSDVVPWYASALFLADKVSATAVRTSCRYALVETGSTFVRFVQRRGNCVRSAVRTATCRPGVSGISRISLIC